MKAPKRNRKVTTNKTSYISDEAFADLKEALESALAFERGKRRDLKVTRIQAPQAPKPMSPKDIAHTTKAQPLTSGVCDDAQHQPQDGPGLGARLERAWRCSTQAAVNRRETPQSSA